LYNNDLTDVKGDISQSIKLLDNNSVYHSINQTVASNSSFTTSADGLYILRADSDGLNAAQWFLDSNRTKFLMSSFSANVSNPIPLKANTTIYTRNMSGETYAVVGYYEL